MQNPPDNNASNKPLPTSFQRTPVLRYRDGTPILGLPRLRYGFVYGDLTTPFYEVNIGTAHRLGREHLKLGASRMRVYRNKGVVTLVVQRETVIQGDEQNKRWVNLSDEEWWCLRHRYKDQIEGSRRKPRAQTEAPNTRWVSVTDEEWSHFLTWHKGQQNSPPAKPSPKSRPT